MKLSDYANKVGVTYKTAHRWFKIEVINLAEDEREGLLDDLVAVIYRFCARLYGQRRGQRKTERITAELKRDDDDAVS